MRVSDKNFSHKPGFVGKFYKEYRSRTDRNHHRKMVRQPGRHDYLSYGFYYLSRQCMTAARLMLDPIFEADLPPEQYAYALMLASEAKAESQNVEKLYNRARLKS